MTRVYVTDCEGPLSKDDNAYDLSVHFIPDGSVFFPLVSKIDDVWADNIRQPGYKAGDTLRLISPFLKASRAINQTIREFSAKNIHLVPGSRQTLGYVYGQMPSYIVSTSYRPYIAALCDVTDFPAGNVFCTELDIDKYAMPERERTELEILRKEIVGMPMIVIPEGARKLEDFSERDQPNIRRLYEIFWKIIPSMECGKMLEEVNPIGGFEKANCIKSIIKKTGCSLSEISYTGDSITDVQAFQAVRKGGGLTVSFNGNSYAVREAEICMMSPNTWPSALIANEFKMGGREAAVNLARNWGSMFPKEFPEVTIVTEENMADLSKRSSSFRKTVRGESVGTLG